MVVVKVKTEASYAGHDVKQNKAVNVTFKMPYTELKNYVGSIQLLNENTTVAVKIGSDKPMNLGTFLFNGLTISRDGDGTLKFNSQTSAVDLENINDLAVRNDEPMFLLLKADVEDLDDEEDEEDEE